MAARAANSPGGRAADEAAAVLAARSPRFVHGFARYMRWYVGRNFHAVRVLREGMPCLPPGRPAVVYTNHPSWWDPAVFIVAGGHFFGDRPAYGPMEAAALEKYGVMRRIGVFGIEEGSRRGAATFLRVSRRVLSDPDAMLWVTAEGRFADARRRPVTLEPGVAHLARGLGRIALVPLALEYTFWNERFPEALLAFGPTIDAAAGRDLGVDGWRDLLRERLTEAMDRLAEAGMARDPARFETILCGRVGIGGFYDLGRRIRAAIRGEKFSAAHEDREAGR
ncbi:MAG TPA: lysophospholipid acyltransferase family protein [Geminicoccaceae bacterium]|nr:lysophospholipid acyltransferase family protein [Geminicoccaceae bacterium]